MRILMVNETFEFAGGAEQYLVDICIGLAKLGHKVGVVYGKRTQNSKLKVPCLPAGRQNCNLKPKTFFVENLDGGKILEVVETFNPDVINLQNVFDPRLYEALVRVKPTLRFVHDHKTYCPGTAKLWFNSNKICPLPVSGRCAFYAYREHCASRYPLKLALEILKRPPLLAALNKLDCVLCNSRYVKNQLVLNGVARDKVVVNPLFPGGCLHPTGEGESPEILFVGRIFVEKGVEYLLRACAQIPAPWALKIVGEGWDLERVKKISCELGIASKVEFLGWQPREKLGEYYAHCRLLVIPSVWPEPFGMIGLEALSFGKPVVAFNVGGIPDWLKDQEAGFLVKRADIDELALKIKLLLKDKALAERLGAAGRKLVLKKFNLERHLDQLLAVYKEVAEGRGSSHPHTPAVAKRSSW